MDEAPKQRCGYTWPEDFDPKGGHKADHQNCCYRETWRDYNHCIWHAEVDEMVEKPIEELREHRETPENRKINKTENERKYGENVIRETTPAEILDGARCLGRCKIGPDVVPLRVLNLSNVFLRASRLSGISLKDTELTNANLRESDLSGAYLGGANLYRASLGNANLSGANLGGADLSEASLPKADLTESYLVNSNLSGAYITNTLLNNSKLSYATLHGAYLEKVELVRATLRGADLSEANLTEAQITGSDFREADLSGTNLTKTNFTNADLSKADLADANCTEADLTDSNLCGTTLNGATFDEAKLIRANFRNCGSAETRMNTDTRLVGLDLRTTNLPPSDNESFRNANLAESNLEGQDLRDYDLRNARLSKANLTDADLSNANLRSANLERALLNRTDLFDTRLTGARLEGAVLGDVQLNAGTFENLKDRSKTSAGLLQRFIRSISGPTGNDAYRCVYDPKSRYEPPDPEADDDLPEVRAGGVYRQFERLAGDNALPEWQSRFFILRQDMQTSKFRRDGSWVNYSFAVVQRALFGYGESFSRVIGWSGLIVFLFSLVYLAGGWIHPVEPSGELGPAITWTRLPETPGVIWDSFYYSTLTFTALGFGDFRPVGTAGQLFTIAETATGAILLALLVFVLGRRAAR